MDSMLKRDHRVFRALTSHDLRWGSNTPEKPSFFEAENDFVRRSSGKKEEEGLVGTRKMALIAAAAAEEGAAALEGRREEEAEEGSRVTRRSQRHEGQKPVNCSVGWRSQLKEERWGCNGGCGGGCSVLGFIAGGGGLQFPLCSC